MSGDTFRPLGGDPVAVMSSDDSRVDVELLRRRSRHRLSVGGAGRRSHPPRVSGGRARRRGGARRSELSTARGARRRDGAARSAGAADLPSVRRAWRVVDRAVLAVRGHRHDCSGIRSCRSPIPAGVIDGDALPLHRDPAPSHPLNPRSSCRFASREREPWNATSSSSRILVGLWGGLAMLVGVSMLLLAAGALAELAGPAGRRRRFCRRSDRRRFSPCIGVFALLWGGAHVWAAMLLRRRRPLGRVLTLALARRQPAGAAVWHGARRLRALDAADRRRPPALRARAPVTITEDHGHRHAGPRRSPATRCASSSIPIFASDIVSLGFVKDLRSSTVARVLHHRADDAGLPGQGSDARSGGGGRARAARRRRRRRAADGEGAVGVGARDRAAAAARA